jgi:molecular chaperone DnaK
MNVSAKDLGTGKEQHITITASSNMSKEDIDKAVKEAEMYAAEDAKRKEEVDTRNQGDQMVYQTEKLINESGDKLDENDKAGVNAELDKVKEALKGTDTDAIKAATEGLQNKLYELSSKIYAQNPEAAGAAPGADAGANPEGVYDADFKDVDEN